MPHKPSESRPVVAVIPHYNMPHTLVPLIGQILGQEYDDVYVLDDHSTNCDITEIVRPFGYKIQLIASTENKGAGGNRNRILEVGPKTLGGALLHFVDADCELINEHTPEIARKLLAEHERAWIGGLVLNADGSWMKYNYFSDITWRGLAGSVFQELTALAGSSRLNKQLRRLSKGLDDFPDIFAEPKAREVFAVSEANVTIPYEMFAAVGGYDRKLRDREVIDLAHRLEAQGAVCRFEPSIAVKHHAVQVRGRTRPLQSVRAGWQIVRKYGLPLH